MGAPEPKRPIHQIAMELRNTMDDLLPDGVGVTISASENADGTGSMDLTVSSWPSGMLMLNRERVVIQRRALLEGRDAMEVNLHGYPYLSHEASHLAQILQTLLDRHFPPHANPSTGETDWPVSSSVTFDPHTLEHERIEIIQSLKKV